MEIFEREVKVSSVCFEGEENVRKFSRSVKLPQAVVPEASHFYWESEGKVNIQLKKANGPSYWPKLVDLPDGADLVKEKVAMWKVMHVKYIEQVEDYKNT